MKYNLEIRSKGKEHNLSFLVVNEDTPGEVDFV